MCFSLIYTEHFIRYLLNLFLDIRLLLLYPFRAGVSNSIPRGPQCLQVFVVSFQSAVN